MMFDKSYCYYPVDNDYSALRKTMAMNNVVLNTEYASDLLELNNNLIQKTDKSYIQVTRDEKKIYGQVVTPSVMFEARFEDVIVNDTNWI